MPAELISATVRSASGLRSGAHGIGGGFSMSINVLAVCLVMPL